ncbi:hypothetical protein EDD85DRAFT_931974 [Armillaria nabsnona]|nr:hypothetical protein EDD85DRAFT_931974 [Armillaria nabsnona]
MMARPTHYQTGPQHVHFTLDVMNLTPESLPTALDLLHRLPTLLTTPSTSSKGNPAVAPMFCWCVDISACRREHAELPTAVSMGSYKAPRLHLCKMGSRNTDGAYCPEFHLHQGDGAYVSPPLFESVIFALRYIHTSNLQHTSSLRVRKARIFAVREITNLIIKDTLKWKVGSTISVLRSQRNPGCNVSLMKETERRRDHGKDCCLIRSLPPRLMGTSSFNGKNGRRWKFWEDE